MTKLTGIIAGLLLIVNCSAKKDSEITHATQLLAEPKAGAKVLAELPKGTVVTAVEYRNHMIHKQKDFIKVEYKGQEGYISPKTAVVGQDPAASVFLTGYKKDYEPFYSPKDKKYKNMYNYAPADKMAAEKVPTEELLK